MNNNIIGMVIDVSASGAMPSSVIIIYLFTKEKQINYRGTTSTCHE